MNRKQFFANIAFIIAILVLTLATFTQLYDSVTTSVAPAQPKISYTHVNMMVKQQANPILRDVNKSY